MKMMQRLAYSAAAMITAIGFSTPDVKAAGGAVDVLAKDWSFEGPFGKYDRHELQRGWQVYASACAGCHGMKYVAFRDLGSETGPAFPPEQVKAIAANFITQIADIDAEGETIERAPKPSDRIPSPFANEEAAKAANNGAVPPDLSNITKARIGHHGTIWQLVKGPGGPEYVYSVLLGYTDSPPAGFDDAGLEYNKYFPGHRIAMAPPLYEDAVEYQDGTAATVEQMASDVTAFLTWAGEPHMIDRKRSGVRNLILLAIFACLVWYSNKLLWKPVKKG